MNEEVKLETANNKWRFSPVGARLLSWESYDPKTKVWREICKADSSKLPTEDGFNGSLLFPWCNRQDGDFYSYPSGEQVTINRDFHLHGGTIANESWNLVSVTPESEVVFQLNVTPSENYPRELVATVKYQVVGLGPPTEPEEAEEEEIETVDMYNVEAAISSLTMVMKEPEETPATASAIPSFFTVDEALTKKEPKEPVIEGIRVEIDVKNLEKEKEAWVGLGTHWYFKNPFGGSINDMRLSLKVNSEVSVDEETLIPDHPVNLLDPIPLEHDFDGFLPRPISGAIIDNCFQIDHEAIEEEDGTSLGVLEKDNFMLEFIPEYTPAKTNEKTKEKKHCIQYVQVYTPEDRNSIAIEPQSSIANHFQHGYDITYNNCVLPPSESIQYSTLFIVTWSH